MTRTASDIASLTDSNAWAIYVGSDDPRDYSADDLAAYVESHEFCADLDTDARRTLLAKLARYVDSMTADA